ncbi:Wzz/FepE/Etk N-terminal domain-containing protein [Desulfoluna spongiiphila]|uniref:Chain length determinant protein n=1 Tax=Desulfoluna spongiiphila TaxID=419481 RepID=A0A1G5JFR0_9BACT|nr:Wzz/FepE/Etk N-terminal domain-containing protein [Desulfoluna spongiiphila]SCY87195.1 Chain length determinant protein [Desulfoluna spongiiphila]
MTTEINHGNQPIPPFQSMPYPDDEIDLREVFATLWKRKKFIGLGVLLFVVAAGVIAFLKPDVYRVKALVSPGIVARKPGGNVTFTNSLESVKGQIDAGAYSMQLSETLIEQFPALRYASKALHSSIPKHSSTLLISYDTSNQNFGKAVLSNLIGQLEKEDSNIIKPFVEGLQAGIDSDKKALSEHEKTLALLAFHLKEQYKAKKNVQQQIDAAIESTNAYQSRGVKSLASEEMTAESLHKALLYNNMVIQNRQVVYSVLKKELSEINVQIASLEKKQQATSVLTGELQMSVEESARTIKHIIPFQELIPVMTEEGRVGPNRRLIVMMSFVCSLFFMIFATLIIEYIKTCEK